MALRQNRQNFPPNIPPYGIVLELFAQGTQRKIAFGSTQVQLNGSGASFNSAVANHNLGVVPIVMFANARQSIGLQVVDAKCQSPTATQLTVLAFIPQAVSPGSTTTIDVDWFVIG